MHVILCVGTRVRITGISSTEDTENLQTDSNQISENNMIKYEDNFRSCYTDGTKKKCHTEYKRKQRVLVTRETCVRDLGVIVSDDVEHVKEHNTNC